MTPIRCLCASNNGSSYTNSDWGRRLDYDFDQDNSVSGEDDILKVQDALTGSTTLSSTGGVHGKSKSIANTERIRKGGTVSC